MMLRLVLVALLLTAGCSAGDVLAGPGAAAATDVAGSWTGRLERPPAPVDVDVVLTGTPGALAGTFAIPAQGVAALPLANVSTEGGTVRFTVPNLPGDAAFAGTPAADGSAIGGRFTQSGASYPLVLHRGTVAASTRSKAP